MKVIIQHPERRTTQAIVVTSSAGNIALILPAQCLELDLQDGETISLHFEAPAIYEIPSPDDLTPEDEERLAAEFASLDSEGHGEPILSPAGENGQG